MIGLPAVIAVPGDADLVLAVQHDEIRMRILVVVRLKGDSRLDGEDFQFACEAVFGLRECSFNECALLHNFLRLLCKIAPCDIAYGQLSVSV
jgi:hypothetical protein